MVTDNGTAFKSEEFQKFLKSNGIRQVCSAPYHPASNGQEERYVQTIKQSLRKNKNEEWTTRLDKVLFSLRTRPNSSTGKSPAELLMNRKLKTLLDRIHPDFGQTQRAKQEASWEQKSGVRFKKGDPVLFRNYAKGNKWLPGWVTRVQGPRNFEVQNEEGEGVRRHTDQLQRRDSGLERTSQEADPAPTSSIGGETRGGEREMSSRDDPNQRPTRARRTPAHLQDYDLS